MAGGFAGSNGASRGRSHDLGRRRGRFADSGLTVSPLGESGGFRTRISVAAMDAGAWGNPDEQKSWCVRMARDVWQFDQQACSSPQVLYLEKGAGRSTAQFLSNLQRAFETENQAHPRRTIPAALTSKICQARASWLLNDAAHQQSFRWVRIGRCCSARDRIFLHHSR